MNICPQYKKRKRTKAARVINRIPSEVVRQAILAHITQHGQASASEIAVANGLTRPTISKYASQLCAMGVLHYVKRRTVTLKFEYAFRLGPAPKTVEAEPGEVPCQCAVKSWDSMTVAVDPWMLPREFFKECARD